MSLLFREASRQPQPFRWTRLVSVALVDAIAQLLPSIDVAIKWPNDVLIGRRKVAGVLAESSWNGVELVTIVGVGLNVNVPAEQLAAFGATSLSAAAAGGRVERAELLRAIVARLDARLAEPGDTVRTAWDARLWGRGQRLRLLDLGREEDVVVLGVDLDGALRVRLADGTERTTTTGELIL